MKLRQAAPIPLPCGLGHRPILIRRLFPFILGDYDLPGVCEKPLAICHCNIRQKPSPLAHGVSYQRAQQQLLQPSLRRQLCLVLVDPALDGKHRLDSQLVRDGLLHRADAGGNRAEPCIPVVVIEHRFGSPKQPLAAPVSWVVF